jgi:hypothetical protein
MQKERYNQMSHVKTAISLPESLWEQAEALAHEMAISRSRLFAIALEDLLRRRKSQRLLEQLNAAYADGPDADEHALRDAALQNQRRMLEGEW